MQCHLYHGLLTALGASIAVVACDRAAAAPTVQNTQSAQPGNGYTVVRDNTGSGHTISYVTNGSEVLTDLCTFSPDGLTMACMYLFASQNGAPNAPTTFLFYDRYSCILDPTSYLSNCSDIDMGSGLIPNSDLSGGAPVMRLHTNTQADPGFVVYAGSGGLIDVTFRKIDLNSTSGQSTTSTDYGTFSVKVNQHSSMTGALATGSVVGASVNEALYSQMGTGFSNSIFHFSH